MSLSPQTAGSNPKSARAHESSSILIIHGLQGNPYKTWACLKSPNPPPLPNSHQVGAEEAGGNKPRGFIRNVALRLKRQPSEQAARKNDEEKSSHRPAEAGDNKPSAVFWPADLLPDDCPNARILMYGYDTKITKYMAGAANKNSIFSYSKDLLFAICRKRTLDRPLIFVAHSLGGIVVKEVSPECADVI